MKRPIVTRSTLLAAATICLALHGTAAGEALSNAVPIFVYWNTANGNAPLSDVSFEDEAQGSIPFDRESSRFKGVRQAQGSWAFHDVTLRYGSETAPLALRTQAGVPGIRIDVALPTTGACKAKLLDRLRTVSENAPVPERINTMLEARHLLALRSNTCPLWAKKDLAEIYFVMSCSLAKKTSFFRVPEEAKARYRQLARNPDSANVQISGCDAQTLGTALKAMRESGDKALTTGDLAGFEAVNLELRAKASDPAWTSAFAVQEVDQNLLRADLLEALYDQQQKAAKDRDYAKALQFNERLSRLSADHKFEVASKTVRLTGKRLQDDRIFLEAQKQKAEVPSQN